MDRGFRKRPRGFFLHSTVFVALTAWALPSLADNLDDAKAKFEVGMEEIKRENYDFALSAFEDRYGSRPEVSKVIQ